MARQKKDYVSLHIKMDAELMERFEEYCDKAGWTKTMAVERMITAFLEQSKEKNEQVYLPF